jgi:uncharacterized protein (UPF0335 family)
MNQHIEEIKRLNQENEMLKNMLNQIKNNIQGGSIAPSLPPPPQNNQFTDSLLDRIRELENEVKELKTQPKPEEKNQTELILEKEPEPPQKNQTEIIMKSKSDPEVIVRL